jgi:hypothetical protein
MNFPGVPNCRLIAGESPHLLQSRAYETDEARQWRRFSVNTKSSCSRRREYFMARGAVEKEEEVAALEERLHRRWRTGG